LLDLLPQIGNRCIIGFFGDAMQAIYDGTVGNITSYVQQGRVREVLKQDNRRNPQPVIELANQLRNDAVIQQLATDSQAPNFGQQGSIRFFYSTTGDVEAIKHHPYFQHWDFADTAQTKELYLTHNLIAAKAQFSCLSDIYDKDRIIEYKSVLQSIIRETGMDVEGFSFGDVINAIGKKPSKTQQAFFEANPELFTRACQTPWAVLSKIYLDKNQLIGTRKGSEEEQNRKGTQRDALITHLYGLQECLHFYNTGQYRQLIRKNKLRINSIEDKKHLKRSIGLLNEMKAASIEEVIQVAHDTGVYYKTEKLLQFIAEKEYVYNRVKELPYLNIFNFYHFVEGYTPFSTQHNVKGAEFNNVLVVLDNGNWNNYNFEYLFCNTGNPNVLERTRKIFYVCCTRTKKNLAVYYHKPIPAVIEQAQRWFGPQNVISLS
jgi:DNA helicase-2/ATP-dependent DNA helicase PcrA